jgi:lysyl-tRNA synthetase class 1
MLLNLAAVINADNPEMLWDYIRAYSAEATPEAYPFLAKLVDHAIAFYRDFVAAHKNYRPATEPERAGLTDLATRLKSLPRTSTAGDIQDVVYAVGKEHKFSPLKAWFDCLYQVLLGQVEGPRFGGFVALYGIDRTIALIESSLART